MKANGAQLQNRSTKPFRLADLLPVTRVLWHCSQNITRQKRYSFNSVKYTQIETCVEGQKTQSARHNPARNPFETPTSQMAFSSSLTLRNPVYSPPNRHNRLHDQVNKQSKTSLSCHLNPCSFQNNSRKRKNKDDEARDSHHHVEHPRRALQAVMPATYHGAQTRRDAKPEHYEYL